jgi:hypothetical protein
MRLALFFFADPAVTWSNFSLLAIVIMAIHYYVAIVNITGKLPTLTVVIVNYHNYLTLVMALSHTPVHPSYSCYRL